MDELAKRKILDPTGTRIPFPRSSSPYLVAIWTTLAVLAINIIYCNKILSNKSLLQKAVGINLNTFVFMQMVTFIRCL
jgi:hypothetical protein